MNPAEGNMINQIIALTISAETGRPLTDIAMPQLIQGVLDEIAVNVGAEGGFLYLLHRAGAAGVNLEIITGLMEKYQAIFTMLPKALYAAINRGMDTAAKVSQN